jgi:DNA-binding NarL/FixJ family response regulator
VTALDQSRSVPVSPGGGRFPVLVIDDHELISSTMVLALTERGYEAHRCRIAGRAEILACAAALPPGLALLDLELGRDSTGRTIDGADLIADLDADGWRVLVVTGVARQDRLAAAVNAGAAGLLPKSSALHRFLDLVEQAADGRLLMPPAERRRWVEVHRRRQAEISTLRLLTTREREVLEQLAAGSRAGSIAAASGVSITTVRTHIRSVLTKFGVRSQLEAVALLRASRGEQ